MKKNYISNLSFKIILTGIMLVFISFRPSAQTITNYTFAASSGTFTALSGATAPGFSGGNEDDAAFNALPIGFDFFYMGTRFTTASASSNGFLVLGADVGDTTTYGYINNLTTWNTPRPVLAPLWDDLAIQVAGNLSYLTNGSAPNRVFTVQWLNAQWDYNATGNTISFQVKLYEGTGKVDFVYRSESGTVNTSSASIGITAITTTGSGSFRSLNNAGTIPTVSSTTETTTISAKPVSGQTYGWTPAVPTAPTSLLFTGITTTGMTLNWTDNSSNETGFAIYRSSDGINYSYITKTAAGATSAAQSGLTATTTYYWKVYAVTEGGLSSALSGSQATSCVPPNISQIPTSNLIMNYKFTGNANDETGANNGTLQGAPTLTTDRFSITNRAYSFNGTTQYVSTANSYLNPTNFSISIWFKTTTTSGGLLMGFGSAQTGLSGNHDRKIYMNNAGQVYFGVYNGATVTVNSTLAYNDNIWHLATATLSSTAGMVLYIDGVQVVSNANTIAENFTGYWRIGYDNVSGWPSVPTSNYFNGTLDDALVYHATLNSSQVATLYNSPDGAGGNSPVCAGSALNLTATTIGGATYSWTGPNSFTSSSQNPTLTYSSAYAGVYTLQVTTSGCTSTAYKNVTTAPTSSTFYYGGSPYCITAGTASVTFSGTAGGTYTSTAGLTINASTGAVTLGTSTAGTYTVTYTVAGGCTATASITISASVAAPTVTSPVNYCQNAAAVQLTATGTNLMWNTGTTSGTVGGTSTLATTTYVDGAFPNNNKKTNFTTTAANVTITTVDYYIPPYQAVTGLVLAIFNSSGTAIATSSTNTTQTAGGTSITIANTFNYTITTAGDYSIGVSAGSGVIGSDDPGFPITEGSGTINVTGVSVAGSRCYNDIKFTRSGSSTAPTPVTTTVGTINYTVTQRVGGCISPNATIAVVVSSPPTTSAAGADQTGAATCGLTTVTLAANTPSVGTGGWSIVSGAGGTVATPTSATSTFSGTAGTSYTLRWTISNSPCTASTDDVVITFNRNPTTSAAGADQTGAATCGLTTVTLAANTPTIGTGTWSIVSGAGGTVTTPTSATSTFSGTAGTSYTLRWTIANSPCTASTDDVVITFNRNPTTSAAGADQTGAATCGLTTVTLAANTPTIGTGTWSIVSGAGGTVTTPTSATSTFSGTAGTSYTLRWTIANSPCTASTDDVVITFNQNPTTSNAGADQTVAASCGTASVTLAANTASVGTGAWSIISGTGGTITTPSSASSTFSGAHGTTYTLRWTISNNSCNATTDDVVITISQYTASADDQDLAGTNTWIGHMYDGTNFSTYIGQFTEAETFNELFGGNTTCFNVVSNSVTRSVYTETFSVKYKMNSSKKGLYVVNLGSDDGSRLTVDGTMVYNNWINQSFTTKPSVLINLAGASSLLYEFYENSGGNQVVFQSLTLVLANTLSTNTTQSICIGSTGSPISGDVYGALPAGITVSGTGYQWSYSITPGGARTDIAGETGATFTPSAAVAPFNTAGTFYIYRNAVLNSVNNISPNPYIGTNESNAAIITVSEAPSATISYTGSPYCSASGTASVTRTGTAGGTYSSTAGLVINATTGDINLVTSTTGTYTVTYTIAASGGCTTYTTTTSVSLFAISNNLVDHVNGAHGVICSTAAENGSATLTAPAGSVFINVAFASYGTPAGTCSAFTIGNCHAATSQAVSENYLLGNNTGTIPATNAVFGDPCNGTVKQLYVQAIYTQPICSGTAPGTITGTTPAGGNAVFTYLWEQSITSASAGFSAAGGTNNAKDYTPGVLNQTTWYRRTVTSGGCSNISTVIRITVTPLPAATISYTGTPFCNSLATGQPVSQTGTTGGTYSSTAGLTLNASTGAITPSTSSAGTYTVTYTMAATGGCAQQTATTAVTITQTPTTSNAGPDQTSVATCGSTTVTLAANVPSAGTGAWSIVSGAGGIVTTPTSATSTFNGTAGTTYTLRWTISNGPCTASTDDVVITFNQNPTTSNAGPDQTGAATCGSTSIALAANTPSVGTGMWSIISGTGGTVTTPSSATSTFNGTVGTTYTLRWTISNSPCNSSTDDVVIGFNLIEVIATSGTASACYTTVKLAFDAINSGTHQGAINIKVNGSTTESAAAVLNASGTGASSYTSINIYPTITGLTISGSLTTPLIDLGGADNVTIDGRVNATGSTRDLTIVNTNTGTGSSTIRFINSAENNIIKYCTVKGASLAGTGGVLFFSTSSAGVGNVNNTIDNCNLAGADTTNRPENIIYSAGTATRENKNCIISNNSIYDFLRLGSSSNGIALKGNTTDWTISGNSFYQTTTFNPTGTYTYRPIYITNTNGNNFKVFDNHIGGSSLQCGGTPWTAGTGVTFSHILYGIDISAGNVTASSIQNNVIANFDFTSKSTVPWQGIRITNGNVDVGTVTGNTIGSGTGNGSITITNNTSSTTAYGIYTNSPDSVNIFNNTIGSVTTVGFSNISCDFIGINKTAAGSAYIKNNLVGSHVTSNSIQAITSSTAGAQTVKGISSAGAGNIIIANNTIANMHNAYQPPTATSGQIVGIDISGAGTYSVSNNLVRELSTTSPNTTASTSASVIGISAASTAAGNVVTGNTIYNLSNTTPTAAISIIGLYYSGSISGTNIVSNNFVHSLSLTSSSTVADMYGIKIGGGTTTYSNNIISIGSGINTGYPIFGIYETGSASNNNNLYFNAVYIGGTTSGTSGLTYALYNNTNNNARDVRNNILYNARSTPGATNTHFAVRIAGTTSLTIDYNNFFANGTGGTICRLGTTNYATLSAWQTALAAIGGGLNSLNVDPLFASAGGTNASNYYPAEILTGINGTGITTDYFGTITRPDPPKMGAIDCSFNPTVTSTTAASRCGTGTVTLTATASAGATIYWYDAATGGNLLGTGTSFTTPSVAVTTTFYAAAIYPACRSSFRSGVIVTVTPAGVWTGAISTDWQTAGNWQCGGVPASSVNVLIPSGLSLYPVISSGIATANDITLQSGATLTITSTLQIAGNINNSGTITTTAGTVEMNGTASQTIPAGTFTANTVNNLTVNNTAGVILAGTLDLTGALTVSNGSLTTGGFLTLKSSATRNAYVASITSVAATPINGNVTVERYVQGRRKYRLITSSVTTHSNAVLTAGQEGSSIWGNWQNSGINTTPNVGTLITGGTSADGFDAGTPNASIYTYDEVNRVFKGYTSANGKNTKYTPLKAGIAYLMFVYGDRRNSVFATFPNNTVLNAYGTLKTGDQTYNTTSDIPLTGVTGQFTLLGNPFASPIDWATISKTNLADTYWGWDPNLSSTGGYITVSNIGGVTIQAPYSGSTGLNQYIQSGQGFFVKTTGASPSLIIKEQDKVSNFNANAFRGNLVANSIPLLAVNLQYVSNGTRVLADGVLTVFDPAFSNTAGVEDATKMPNTAETITIVNDTSLLSIDARKMPQNNDTLFLNVLRLTKPQYTLQIFAAEMAGTGVLAFLRDSYLNTTQPLSLSDTNNIVIDINTSIPASFNINRFKIVFQTSTVILPLKFISITAAQKNKEIRVEWAVAEETGVKKYELERSADGIRFNKAGEIAARGNNTSVTYNWLDVHPATGNNFYRIRAIDFDGKFVLSKMVLVKINGTNTQFKIFPNPVTNHQVNIQANELGKGPYQLLLYNQHGLLVMQRRFDHTGGAFNQLIAIDTRLAAGIYNLQIAGEGIKYNLKINIQ